MITSTNNIDQLRNIAATLISRFSSSSFRELDHTEPESWAKESYEIATKIAYQNGNAAYQRVMRKIAGMFLR